MSQLQLGLIVAGVLLVVGVLIYNWLQERRIRQRPDRAAQPSGRDPSESDPGGQARREPVLNEVAEPSDAVVAGRAQDVARPSPDEAIEVAHDPDFRAPMAPLPPLSDATLEEASDATTPPAARPRPSRGAAASESSSAAAPDPDIESVVILQPAKPAGAGTLAAGLHARLGKPVRWYGRRDGGGPWQRLTSETRGEYSEFAACMLLADRNGAATRSQIDGFLRLAGEIAPTIPGALVAPDPASEADRAETLDRLCSELDMQIGLTIHKSSQGPITGTRLRGVAEAAGFRLAPSGRFEWVQEETGAVLFTLHNVSDEPFTLEGLRVGSATGVVFLLDVPRVADPPRAFDQMKLAAKRMARTLDGELVDDNRRPLNDAGLAVIRAQVAEAAAALKHSHIEPGSPRALKLFTA